MTVIIPERIISLLTIVFLLVQVPNCWAQLEERPVNPNTEVRYYGTGCLTVQRSNTVLLTDPYVSNLSGTQITLGKVKTDVEYVEQYINPATLQQTKMVVAGHSHYNHLLDMPYLSQYIPETTPVVLNHTGRHILSYYKLKQQMIGVNDISGAHNYMGYWYYSADSSLRVMAFKSKHQPKTAGIGSQDKIYSSGLIGEPQIVSDWQAGKTFSYMVDFLEADTIGYRMFFMSSGAKSPEGMFPKSLMKERTIDDLFISASAEIDFNDYPAPIINLCKPKRIFLIHWERSSRSKEKESKAIDEERLDYLKKMLDQRYGAQSEVIIPTPLNYY